MEEENLNVEQKCKSLKKFIFLILKVCFILVSIMYIFVRFS